MLLTRPIFKGDADETGVVVVVVVMVDLVCCLGMATNVRGVTVKELQGQGLMNSTAITIMRRVFLG